jgi:hypothetical protein
MKDLHAFVRAGLGGKFLGYPGYHSYVRNSNHPDNSDVTGAVRKSFM